MSHETSQRKRREFEADKLRRNDEDIRYWLGHAGGRRVFTRLVLDMCGLMATSGAPMLDELTMREGRRQIGGALYEEAQRVCPDLVAKAMAERHEERKTDKAKDATLDELAREDTHSTGMDA